MTETQRKFLTEYLGECWHEMKVVDYNGTVRYQTMECYKCGCICNVDLPSYHRAMQRTFTTIQDKKDLLMAIIEKGEWSEFHIYAVGSCPSNWNPEEYTKWLIQLSPEKTAELICKWKGVE